MYIWHFKRNILLGDLTAVIMARQAHRKSRIKHWRLVNLRYRKTHLPAVNISKVYRVTLSLPVCIQICKSGLCQVTLFIKFCRYCTIHGERHWKINTVHNTNVNESYTFNTFVTLFRLHLRIRWTICIIDGCETFRHYTPLNFKTQF